MKIGIIGATGIAGSAFFREATKRGHEVSGFVRHPDKHLERLPRNANLIAKDGFTLTRGELLGFDVIIDAVATPPAQAYLHLDLAAHLIHELRETSAPRAIFVLGAGSLYLSDDQLLVDRLKQDPQAASYIAVPQYQLAEYRFLQSVDNVNWLGLSPSRSFIEGPSTPFVRGEDHVLIDPEGHSAVNSDTLAVALLDELETPTIQQRRFTVRNA